MEPEANTPLPVAIPAAAEIDRKEKALSNTRAWQAQRIAKGQCLSCDAQATPGRKHCPVCQAKIRDNARNRYRAKKGIPIDAPLSKRGAKRHVLAEAVTVD